MNKVIAMIALPLTLSLTACASDSSSSYSGNKGYTGIYSSETGFKRQKSSYQNDEKAITRHETKWGTVWSTPEGMTLYTFSKDQENLSNCTFNCVNIWPPHYADKNAKAFRNFHVIEREDGHYQWAHKSQPLYTFSKDQYPGDTVGQGALNRWYIARVDDAPVLTYKAGERMLLTDAEQMSLYTFDNDHKNSSNCTRGCAQAWPPLLANHNAKTSGPFSIFQRNDGTWQWALSGQPLYTRSTDKQPGDMTGDGVGGVWHLAKQP